MPGFAAGYFRLYLTIVDKALCIVISFGQFMRQEHGSAPPSSHFGLACPCQLMIPLVSVGRVYEKD